MIEDRIKIEDYIGEELNINDVVKESLLSCEDEVHHDHICMEIKQNGYSYPLFTYRNFSATVGAQKSRKTFFTCMMMAPAAMNGEYEGIKARTGGRKNIYFDTEQARYHAQKSNRRISVMSGNGGNSPLNFEYYALRKYSYLERLTIITEVLRKTNNIGFVVIDGIRDLVSSVNDEQQATELIENLMRWTDEYNCHINIIIHLKKGDFATPRGWLGTEIQNKAETVIEVKKDDEFPATVSRVIPRDMRGIEFNEFSFEISGEGLPELVDIEQLDHRKKTAKEQAPF